MSPGEPERPPCWPRPRNYSLFLFLLFLLIPVSVSVDSATTSLSSTALSVSSNKTSHTKTRNTNKPRLFKVNAQLAGANNKSNKNTWRPTKSSFRRQEQPLEAVTSDEANQTADSGLQVSITPRVSLLRVPVDSNVILKCLISSQTNKQFSRAFKIRWSRFMYDENVYEELETSTGLNDEDDDRNRHVAPRVLDRRDDEPSRSIVSSRPDTETNNFSGLIEQTASSSKNRLLQLREFLARSRQETHAISDLLVEATLSINEVKASDNATYYCTATDGVNENNQAHIDLLALSRPVVRLERVQPARDSKSALVLWSISSDGNTPIKKTILMVRNDSQAYDQRASQRFRQSEQVTSSQQSLSSSSVVLDNDYNQWQRIDLRGDGEHPSAYLLDEQTSLNESSSYQPNQSYVGEDSVVRADVDVTSIGNSTRWPHQQSFNGNNRHHQLEQFKRNQRAYNLTGLLPGVTYQLRLAAINDMGQSDWSHLSTSMPNEIPAQISDVFVLSRTSDSLAIGWRRPPYDGAKTIRYEMQLFDLNRTLTLDANTNTNISSSSQAATSSLKTNFMYYFVNLNPGTDYHFHVRACSRAGCSSYSSPKLLASTMDGEPDEPIDVELSCNQSSRNMTVSWLPPLNVRGKLLNYSVTIESSARYRNQTGHWTSDDWRTTLETNDNHTLSLDVQNLLLPNTNYSARVCANNRSKHCGKMSPTSGKSQCFSLAELPSELPPGIELNLRGYRQSANDDYTTTPVTLSDDKEQTLVLDLPAISWRNGSIDCIQVVLIRLPETYQNTARALSDYLPDDPAAIELHEYFDSIKTSDRQNDQANEATTTTTDPYNRQSAAKAFAYLADELDQNSQMADNLMMQQVVLGDGSQGNCSHLWLQAHQVSSSNFASTPQHDRQLPFKPIHAFDGSLIAQTYYTGFLRLIHARASSTSGSRQTKRMANLDTNVELLTKYSNYFSPVKTGQLVPEVSDDLLAHQYGLINGEPHPSFCKRDFVASIQSKLIGSDKPCKALAKFSEHLGKNLANFYGASTSFITENTKLDSLGRLISRSPRPVQILQIGLIVVVVSLALLFVIYLITLPATIRRKRKRKLRHQLNQHESAAKNGLLMDNNSQQQASNMQAMASSVGYQPVEVVQDNNPNSSEQIQQGANGTNTEQANYNETSVNQCHIHSSPMSSSHVCQQHQDNQLIYNDDHHPNHHQQQQLEHQRWPESANNGYQFDNYDRNCRTVRRVSANQAGDLAMPQSDNYYHHHHHHQHNHHMHQHQEQLGFDTRHLTMQHNSVLALAKKINKSLPVNLFQAIFECRLRNGWLREEYEQLPRQAIQSTMNLNDEQVKLVSANANSGGRHIKLRPQLVVSNDDAVSALISGNDLFEASLIKLRLPLGLTSNQQVALGQMANQNNNALASVQFEKHIICAKSPLNADSVWDFWRLIYEREVSTLVMLTPNEDVHTGELRCAQYWPTCDNEETTILSPRNEHVNNSTIPPATFKIRQETLTNADLPAGPEGEFIIRQLTLVVMATKGESLDDEERKTNGKSDDQRSENNSLGSDGDGNPDDSVNEEQLVIVERTILHFQFLHWNASSASNQMKLIKFIELVNERHSRALQQQASPGANWRQISGNSPILVHCANGVGRSGLFAAMSFVFDDLKLKITLMDKQQVAVLVKLNLFQLVAKMRQQRDMLLSPYRFYELLYQLTARCIPVQELRSTR